MSGIHMAPGTLIHNRYVIGEVMGYGGFGITYMAWDRLLEQKVAVKEYLPAEFSTRIPGSLQVTVFNGERQEQFRDGMEKFIIEAKNLAAFQNEPGIVKVFDAFRENDTAYIIMEFLEGRTLAAVLAERNTIPEEEAIALMNPVMMSLRTVHERGILHRDISPDNIFITDDRQAKLIDFGASRHATTSYSRSLSVIVKAGYSPEEQYRSRGDQGKHTDVYALAATMYTMLTGAIPPDAMERRARFEEKNKDILVEPRKLNRNISPVVETAILNAMNVRIEERTPDIDTFMKELEAETPVRRVNGSIRKINAYAWPRWLKILLPSVAAAAVLAAVLLMTGVIRFDTVTDGEINPPEGMAAVPDVETWDKDLAIKKIEEAGFNPVPNGQVDSVYVNAGMIVLQSPAGGTYQALGDDVYLTVSSGEAKEENENSAVIMPYVEWKSWQEAVEELQKAGLGDPELEYEYDDNVPKGDIVSQNIEEGTELEAGDVVRLTVSRGQREKRSPG